MRFLNDKKTIVLLMVMACFLTCLFVVNAFSLNLNAEGMNDEFMQIIYNQENGLTSNEVNCIYQTDSGYIWIGTESGLYRYNGSEFRLYNLWDTDRDDVYYINTLFQDSKGRLWVGTNNYGLFYLDGVDIVHFTNDYYNGVKSINDICEAFDGSIYVATAYGLYSYGDGEAILDRNESLAGQNVQSITRVDSTLWGISNGNSIFSIDKYNKLIEKEASEYTSEDLSIISSDELGRIYIGTAGNDVISFSGWKSFKVLKSYYAGINDILTYNGHTYVCTDNGVGYFRSDDSFFSLSELEVNSYITSMIVDYEGNYWFSSKRSGVLFMARSKFTYINKKYGLKDSIANAVYSHNDMLYIGTDDGLIILNYDGTVMTNELTEYLDGVSVRDIKADTAGNIWIATYRRYGVIKVSPSGKLTVYSRSKGLSSNYINCLLVLNNGDIAVGTEEGINLINTSGEIYKTYDYDSGIEYPNFLGLYQNEDGVLFAGSDGGGLYIIDNDDIKNFTEDDGLSSNVITCFAEGANGLWIGTNNGLSFFNETLRSISIFDFSNNISSILILNKDVYIIGSKGLFIADEDSLLGTTALNNRYISSGDGISSPVTRNSKSIILNNKIYLCTGNGVLAFDTNNIPENDIEPKITVTDVDVDGIIMHYNQTGGSITIPSNTQRVEISFAVLSFVNRENIHIEYQLEGFDNEPQILTGGDNLQAVYTNLEGGKYTFYVSASNGDGVECKEKLSFNIEKKLKFYEYMLFKYVVSILIIIIIFVILFFVFYLYHKFKGKNREFEDLSKEHEDAIKSNTAKTDYLANMSNEIKLPINAMISKANTMIKEGSVDIYTANELRTIIDKGNDVLEKVDETILLARLESGAEELANDPYSITTLICDLSDSMLNKLSDQPIKFVVDLGENIPDILVGDFDKIKTILGIILENSIKFTKEGSITLSVDCYDYNSGDEGNVNLIFSISDTGTGISEERITHLFEIYYEDESKKSVINTGNGISLSIAKKIVDLMEGDIEVESTEGAGSTFTVSIKQIKPAENIAKIPMNENTFERVSREEAERMWAPELRILLVDDVEISRNVALDVIKSMDVMCDAANGGLSAIDMVINNDYDMVFMDIAMPVMNGIDALKEIRDLSGDKYKNIPIVAMSEDVIGKNKQEIIDEGFCDVVLKPFDITVFAGIINRFADPSKIKYRSNDISQYINDSRYGEGLKKLEDFFDVKNTLEKIGGNIDVYNRILSTFYNQNKGSIDELSFRYKNDPRGFRNKIHIIRNGCQSIGAVEASEIAFRIENAINNGDSEYIKNNLSLMYDCLTVINQYIREYIEFVKSRKLSEEDKETSNSEKKVSDDSSVKTKSDVDNRKPVVSSDAALSNDEDYEDLPEEADIYEDEAEEYTEALVSEEEAPKIIDIDSLRAMREATYVEDMSLIRKLYKEICKGEYGADDIDFLNVLSDSIEKKDFVEINELLGTYISLKSSL